MEIVYFLISGILIILTLLFSRFICRIISKIEKYPKEFDLKGFKNGVNILHKTAKIPRAAKLKPVQILILFIGMFKTLKTLKKIFKPFV